MPYQPGIPTGTVDLDEDYLNLQENFTALNTIFGVNHTTLDLATAQVGYHTNVQQIPLSVDPSAVPGISQSYPKVTNDGISTDTQMFLETGNGLVTPMTRNFQPVLATNGYTFMPGGLILQWGLVNGTHGGDNHFNGGDTGTVTFSTANIAFPNNCFSVWSQPMYTNGNVPGSGSAATVGINSSFTNIAFRWFFGSPSNVYTRFFWFAIGN